MVSNPSGLDQKSDALPYMKQMVDVMMSKEMQPNKKYYNDKFDNVSVKDFFTFKCYGPNHAYSMGSLAIHRYRQLN